MPNFTPTNSQSITMSATSTPIGLNLSGNPTVAYITCVGTGILQGPPAGQQNPSQLPLAPSQLHQAYVALGGAGVAVHGPQDGALVTQTAQRFVLAGATYIAAVNANADGLLISLGTEA